MRKVSGAIIPSAPERGWETLASILRQAAVLRGLLRQAALNPQPQSPPPGNRILQFPHSEGTPGLLPRLALPRMHAAALTSQPVIPEIRHTPVF